jgi:hypothetical protein
VDDVNISDLARCSTSPPVWARPGRAVGGARRHRDQGAPAAEVDLGLARGVFGSPFIIVDGEAFWGADRLPQLERWLETGPF